MHTVTAVLLLTARFYSLVNVPSADRIGATHVAARILHTAGIEIAWTDCNDRSRAGERSVTSEACLVPPRVDEVIVRLVSSRTSRDPHVRMGGDTLGDAYVDTATAAGSLATVYVDRVDVMARAAGIDVGTLLGRVIAHEIGHLLIGTATHRSSGLMRAEWSTTLLQRGVPDDWRFSAIDAAQVRNGLMRRGRTETRSASPESLPAAPCVASAHGPIAAACPSCPVCPASYQPTACPLTCSSSQALSGAK